MRNPHHVCGGVGSLRVDGREVAGNAIPQAPEGARVRVEVVLEAPLQKAS